MPGDEVNQVLGLGPGVGRQRNRSKFKAQVKAQLRVTRKLKYEMARSEGGGWGRRERPSEEVAFERLKEPA